MSYYAETYSDIANRLNDWLEKGGNNVSNLALDLLNRAQRWLELYRPWSDLEKIATLTVSSKQATLPSDMGILLDVWADTDSDNKPDNYYYNEAGSDNGYYITDSFTKAAGHSKVLTFYSAPSNTVKIKYRAALSAFEGTGTEYSFFPGDLLLRTAQKLHIEETDIDDAGMRYLLASQKELLHMYEQAHQYNNADMRMVHIDDLGSEVMLENYSLHGGATLGTTSRRDRDYDSR